MDVDVAKADSEMREQMPLFFRTRSGITQAKDMQTALTKEKQGQSRPHQGTL